MAREGDHLISRGPLQVQLDSITANELGDPSAIVSIPGRPEMTELQNWETTPRLGAVICMLLSRLRNI